MKARRITYLLAAAALLAGCFKEVSYKTNYVLKPLAQELSGDPTLPLEGLKAYAFNADTSFYTVASYEDALNGVICLKDNPSETIATPAATAEPYVQEGAVGWMQMLLSSPSQMVLTVDPAHRLYAYTQQSIPENLSDLYVSVIFKPWKEGFSYKDGNWMFFNEFYTPPVYLDCFIDPSAQSEEGGSTSEISNLKAYAYAVDTTAWYIASYDDAAAGKIISKNDVSETRTNPNFQAYLDSESGLYKMEVSTPTLMIVVVDRTNLLYAYTKRVVDLEGASPTFPVIFRLWKQSWIDREDTDGWVIVNPKFAPDDPDTQTQALRR